MIVQYQKIFLQPQHLHQHHSLLQSWSWPRSLSEEWHHLQYQWSLWRLSWPPLQTLHFSHLNIDQSESLRTDQSGLTWTNASLWLVLRRAELHSEGCSAGHIHIAVSGETRGHLSYQQQSHVHPGLSEPGAGEVDDALLAPAEGDRVILLLHSEVAVQVIPGVLQDRALGWTVESVIIDSKPRHHSSPLLPRLDQSSTVSVGFALINDNNL